MPVSSRTGIAAAGNWIVDTTKMIDVYPGQDMLANISSEERNNGGGAFNVLCNLSNFGVTYPLRAVGLLGNDSDGDWIVEYCRERRINTDLLHRHASAPTSYTDVMTVQSTGRRTFFHQRGSNRLFGPEHILWEEMQEKIFYLGYLLLLDTLDSKDPEYGTVASGVLKEAGSRGLCRVVDLVSVDVPDYSEIVLPALPHIDVLLCNEVEVERVTGVEVSSRTEEQRIHALLEAGRLLLKLGVRDWLVIHMPQGAIALSSRGEQVLHGSVAVPPEKIVGAAGAGDAFATGVLHGLHENLPMSESLRLAASAAACCLRHPTTSHGVSSLTDCISYGEHLGFRKFGV